MTRNLIRTTLLTFVLMGLWALSESDAYVRSTDQRTGRPLFWASHAVTLTLNFPNVPCVSAPGSCYETAASAAAQDWNKTGARFTFTTRLAPVDPCLQDGRNAVSFGTTFCGQSFPPGVLAITGTSSLPTGEIRESAVLFYVDPNPTSAFFWDVYEGPQRSVAGTPIYDFYRVASHEFGHVLGLAHPDDYGQFVRALMNSKASDIGRPQPDDIRGIHAIYGSRTPLPSSKGILENPGHQTFKSGIGVISGWACEANRVEVAIGQTRFQAVYGSERSDTRGVCGDTNNGFVILFNWNVLGDGVHTARLLVDGRMLGSPAEFKVTTFGQEFARGLEGTYTLFDFPRLGNETLIGWDQNVQNFSILERR